MNGQPLTRRDHHASEVTGLPVPSDSHDRRRWIDCAIQDLLGASGPDAEQLALALSAKVEAWIERERRAAREPFRSLAMTMSLEPGSDYRSAARMVYRLAMGEDR